MERLVLATNSTMLEYYQRCREAEQHRDEEQQAAVVLQASWRGCLQRQELDKLRWVAVVIQKCWRGFLGRRRFAAVLAAHNTLLRQAYFDHHATVIQNHWRGHYSRAHIHDFYARKAFLQSVAAANAAVREEMEAELQAALEHKHQEAQAAAKQHFDTQVSKLHYLSSTASIPGIFSPQVTAAAAPGQLQAAYTVAGQPLEHHLRTAVKQKAVAAVKQQQAVLKRALGNTQQGMGIFPAGIHAPSGCCLPGLTQQTVSSTQQQHSPERLGSPSHTAGVQRSSSSTSPGHSCCPAQQAQTRSSSRGTASGSRGSQRLQPLDQKLAHKLVESCVDEVFAARAQPNMPDGSFNPGLSLQQAAEYEAAREAADLERRLERGLMLVLHQGQPFIPITSKANMFSTSDGAEEQADAGWQQQSEPGSKSNRLAPLDQQSRECSPDGTAQQHWRHNKHTGGMFSKHLKQVY